MSDEKASNVRLPGMNEIRIDGRIGKDLEMRYMQDQRAFVKFGLCNTEYYKGRDGSRQERITWVDVTLYGAAAEYLAQNCGKGSPVIVFGRLVQNEWTDKSSGEKRKKLEVMASRVAPLSWANEMEQTSQTTTGRKSNLPSGGIGEDDDLPF